MIIQAKKDADGKVIDASEWKIDSSKLAADKVYKNTLTPSPYTPSKEEIDCRAMILRHFSLGYMNMYTPRVEFNDLCVIDRMQVDQMAFNTYQPNNGQANPGDEINAWKSRAMKPVVRNKCISIAAHATARLIFPKINAWDSNSDSQEDAAQVMRDLMEWAGDQANYENTSLRSVITALTDPASIVYKEYCEVYKTVKRPNLDENGKPIKGKKYKEEQILDTNLSGFKDTMVPADELFIENFYEPDIQKQGWLVWRRVYSYALAEAKYKQKYPDKFKYVTPGVQVLYNDANQSFYQVYDQNMRPYDVEDVTYFNPTLDLKIIIVNGVMLTDPDNANPRNDKMLPFLKFGYELINNRCFYYKSLAFKLQQDANIVNSLYPMIIDGTYLNIFPAMVSTGGETIGSDVIIPGAVTTLTDTNADLRAIQSTTSQGLQVGMQTLMKVDESINESSADNIQSGQPSQGSQTAYEISRLEQNAATVLGLFIKMISAYVKDYGKLTIGDILQYLTIIDADKITDKPELVYKTFLLHDKQNQGKHKKIVFDGEMSDEPVSGDDALDASYGIMEEQGGSDSDTTLYKANPSLFRDLTFMTSVDADVLNPRSDDLERAFDLETFDRMIGLPQTFDPEEVGKFLLSTNPRTKKDPDKFINKALLQGQDPLAMATMQAQGQPQPGQQPAAGNGPLANAMGKTPLPQSVGVGQVGR